MAVAAKRKRTVGENAFARRKDRWWNPANIPPAVRAFILKRARELAGALMIIFATLAFLSLVSYSADDPSFNHATDGALANWLGAGGAVLADLSFQLFGLTAFAIVVGLFASGRALISRAQSESGMRMQKRAAAVTAFILLAAFFAAFEPPSFWPYAVGLSGLVGDASLSFFNWCFSPLGVGLGGFLAPASAGAIGLVLGMYAGSFRLTSLWRAAGWALAWAQTVANAVAAMLERRRAPKFERKSPFFDSIEKLKSMSGWGDFSADRDAPVFEESDFEETDPLIESPITTNRVTRGPKKLKQGKREKREAQPTLKLLSDKEHELPPLSLLTKPPSKSINENISDESLEQNARLLEAVLEDFGVRGEILNVRPGPVVTLYELQPAPGIKSSRVIGLADDIARSMSAVSARVAVVPGRNAIGIELPNAKREMVFLRELLSSTEYETAKAPLNLALGKNIGGEPVTADLSAMPHLLVAGTTGSGKSVAINTMILSLLYRLSPDQCKLIMIDPKMLELSVYDGIPHLLAPVVTDPRKAIVALKWVVREMEDRYRKMSKLGVRNIAGFNARLALADESGEELRRTVQTGFDKESGEPVFEDEVMDLEAMPLIVVIVDEMADLMMVAGKEIEGAVQRLAQMARAAGIHMITATQRPSVDVITGTIKANFPTRVSFQVTSKIDSRTILGEQGAEQLLGQGDMLFMAGGGRIRRVHAPFVSDEEVEKVVAFLKRQGAPEYLEAVTEASDEDFDPGGFGLGGGSSSDEYYDQAVAIVARDRKVSTSYIQRKLQIGYNRAARIIEDMEEQGVISGPNHQGRREVLAGDHSDI
jgi:S-DNA-T family DNA segregation ATPase FtsK/SpoIIIE